MPKIFEDCTLCKFETKNKFDRLPLKALIPLLHLFLEGLSWINYFERGFILIEARSHRSNSSSSSIRYFRVLKYFTNLAVSKNTENNVSYECNSSIAFFLSIHPYTPYFKNFRYCDALGDHGNV